MIKRKYSRKIKIIKDVSFLISFFILCYSFLNHNTNSQQKISSEIVEKCYDGDTCTTESGEKIRLACIDAPEIRGKNADPLKAKASREFINNLLSNKKVTIKRIDTDRYGRTVAEIFLEGKNIQKLMIKNGFAKIHRKYFFHCDWTYKMEKVFG